MVGKEEYLNETCLENRIDQKRFWSVEIKKKICVKSILNFRFQLRISHLMSGYISL